MILVDSSIWIDHLRATDRELAALLDAERVLAHPFVIGVALGHLRQRAAVMKLLRDLPAIVEATNNETVRFIETENLAGTGIGYVDAHLLASTRLTEEAEFWTRDKRLWRIASRLNVARR